jgi:hypothetical protein
MRVPKPWATWVFLPDGRFLRKPPGPQSRTYIKGRWTCFTASRDLDKLAASLSREGGPTAVAKAWRNHWSITAYSSGRVATDHASHADPWPDLNDRRRVRSKPVPVGRRGSLEVFARLFGADARDLDPYLVHFTRAEMAAVDLLSDGLTVRFVSDPRRDRLPSPLLGGFVGEALIRLGVPAAPELFVPTRRMEEDPSAPRLDAATVRAARKSLEAEDADRQLAGARLLLSEDPAPALRTLRRLARREDSIGAEALRLLASTGDPDILRDILPGLPGLPPLEQAVVARFAARTEDPSLAEGLRPLLSSPSLLVRLEAIEAHVRCSAGMDLRDLRSLARRGHEFDRALILAAVAGGEGTKGERSAKGAVRAAPRIVLEEIPLRHGRLTVRHTLGHLRSRIGALRFLQSLDRAFDDRSRLESTVDVTGPDPLLGGVLDRVRACGIRVELGAGVDPGRPVKAGGDGPSDVPLYAMVERAIRASEGGLAVTAARNTLRFHRRRGAL